MRGTALEDVQHRLRARLAAQGDVLPLVDQVRAAVAEGSPLLGGTARERLASEVLAHVAGLGPIQFLLDDPEVTDILVNGPGRAVWVERSGCLEEIDCRLDEQQIAHAIEKVVGPLGLRVDRSSPLVDARLPDGSRVNAVVPPLAVDGPCLTIRRFSARAVPLEGFAPPGVVALLVWAVRARLGIVVSGGTGAGKTTLLNALAAHIPEGERVVTVEDTAELRLPGHVVRLEARPANADGVGEVSMRALVRNALRMRPDRIVVGEVRGPEALDMLQAMNTGHEGSLSTCHANSPDDALRRLETMVLMGGVALPLAAIRSQIESALDLVVQVGRQPGGRRSVVAVSEVVEQGPWSSESGFEGGERSRLLADAGGVVSLPRRRSRAAGAPTADPAWVR